MSFLTSHVPRSLMEQQESSQPLNNPARVANVLSRQLTQGWLNNLFKKGSKGALDDNDIYDVLPEDATLGLADELERHWIKEKMTKEKPSLFTPFAKFLGFSYLSNVIYMFLKEGFRLVQPIYIGKLVAYFTVGSDEEKWNAYLYAGIIIACALGEAIVHHPMFLGVMRAGMHLRIATAALIYRKALKMNHSSLSETTTGKIVNLITNDVQKLDQVAFFLLYLIVAPFIIAATSYLCWREMGISFLPGLVLLLLLVPFQAWIGRFFATLKMKSAAFTDERIGVMNEVICAMRIIKMYTWEDSFDELVSKVRMKESDKIKRTSRFRALNASIFIIAIPIMTLAMFVTYVLTGNILTSEKVFTVIGIFMSARVVMTIFVPSSIMFLKEGGVCMKRIQEFLLIDEGVVPMLDETRKNPRDVIVNRINASWDKDRDETLKEISFKVSPGELLMVIGPVGSGKSSLLMALLYELPLTSGEVHMSRNIAYVSQSAWVFSGTLKENVLFGQTYDREKYHKVIKACALDKDIKDFHKGDQTLIGERGVTLSGGQRARVNLARALYYDADVYLMDDPLSAVDSIVGKHIFDECIRGLLKSKVCILVSHQLQYLKDSNSILCLQEGKVVGYGNLEYLIQIGLDIVSLVQPEEVKEGLVDTDEVVLNEKTDKRPTSLLFKQKLDLQRSLSTPPHERISNRQLLDMYISRSKKKCPHRQSWHPVAIGSFTPQSNRRCHNMNDTRSMYIMTGGRDSVLMAGDSMLNLETCSNHGSNLTLHSIGQANFSAQLLHTVFPRRTRSSSLASVASASVLDLELSQVHRDKNEGEKEEERSKGSVSWRVYKDYVLAGTSAFMAVLAFAIFLLGQACVLVSDWWLARWADRETIHARENSSEDVIDSERTRNISVYVGLVAGCIILSLTRALLFFYILINASQHLHNRMFAAILRAPIYFFDSNPVGRILNRFSKDIGFMDDLLPATFYEATQLVVLAVAIILLSVTSQPYLLIGAIPVVIIFVWLRQYYVKTAREIKRIESLNRSPIYSHVSATLQGLCTIRALHTQPHFLRKYNKYQDRHTSAWFLILTGVRWLGFRLDMLCFVFFAIVVFAPLAAEEVGMSVSATLVGLALLYTKQLFGMFQFCVRQTAEVENQMVSVERVLEYCDLEPESELEVKESKPSKEWPQYGIISGEKLCFSYHSTLPRVLNDLYFCIRSKEKVGIVGRTGAGKSSLISAFFRLAEPNGVIRIDGVSITEMGLRDLRSKLSIIPQDPIIFAGSVKKNLDPFGEHSDIEIWDALEQVQMKEVVENLPDRLDSLLSESGSNLSVGQRQLICLARALLKRNRILIIDEATANVDHKTDSLIQETLRNKFKDCTVLTIAHRLNTIMDSERVMVLHEGRLVEFDEPYELLQKSSSRFSELVQEVGGTSSEKLLEMARKAHQGRLRKKDSVNGSHPQHVQNNSKRNSEDRNREMPNGVTDNHITCKANGTVGSTEKQESSC
ncbi:multidrug resistance-associated protein 4-like [Dendronephthya gigantea]|uniref:multidrug resistance-associated protein 4-like n=1 Tax=Dendronephthya gigantea TaxID=151771 RepID=UPI00106D163D|nr:multidrug resistance-associated protein 4-like [Dendronephthya gigantea]